MLRKDLLIRHTRSLLSEFVAPMLEGWIDLENDSSNR